MSSASVVTSGVNDSGGRGVAYASGWMERVQSTLNFRAQPFDVEAVAVLYIAEVGDSNRRRSLVRIFSFKYSRVNGLTVS